MTSPDLDFTGRRVLITAGASGIGLAIATTMKGLGADVFVTDLNAEAVDTAKAVRVCRRGQ